MQLTMHPHDIAIGDYVVGFPTPVIHTRIDGWQVEVHFADGQHWTTTDHFATTVTRGERRW